MRLMVYIMSLEIMIKDIIRRNTGAMMEMI